MRLDSQSYLEDNGDIMPNIFEIDGGKAAIAPPEAKTGTGEPENPTAPRDVILAAQARGALDGGAAPSIREVAQVHATSEMEKGTLEKTGAIDGGDAPQSLPEALLHSLIEAACKASPNVEPIDAGGPPASILEAGKKKTITQ